MFEQKDSLPRTKGRTSPGYRNGQLDLGHGAANMGWHVVRSFGGVPVKTRILFDKAPKEGDQVPLHIGVRVLLYGQRSAGVLQEDNQQSRGDPLAGEPPLDLASDVIEALPPGLHRQDRLRLA